MPAPIRGLTLWRPWQAAFLMPERLGRPGPKRVENRTWYPRWACLAMSNGMAYARTGRPLYLALHAGRQRDREALEELRTGGCLIERGSRAKSAPTTCAIPGPVTWPCGACRSPLSGSSAVGAPWPWCCGTHTSPPRA